MVGLTAAPGDRNLSRASLVATRARRVLSYQLGRAFTYALLGAMAGLLGSSVEESLGGVTRVAGLILAVVVIGVGVAKLPPLAVRWGTSTIGEGLLRKVVRSTSRLGPAGSARRLVLMGVAMGLLPCMLMFWVLAVSATSASALHGAGLMLVLVAMTTPVLIGASCASGLSVRSKAGPWVISFAMVFSGLWLGAVAAAANGWLPHVHLPFRLFGEMYTIMLF